MTVYVATMDDVVFSIHIPNGWNKTNCTTVGTSALTITPVKLINTGNSEWPADCCQLGGGTHNPACPTIDPTIRNSRYAGNRSVFELDVFGHDVTARGEPVHGGRRDLLSWTKRGNVHR
jgi:hypothetical protein